MGYFIEPTVIVTTDPKFKTMVEELFGPVITVFVYDDAKYEETLDLCDASSPYALTGSIFARDRAAITTAMERLRYAAGNFYINDKLRGLSCRSSLSAVHELRVPTTRRAAPST